MKLALALHRRPSLPLASLESIWFAIGQNDWLSIVLQCSKWVSLCVIHTIAFSLVSGKAANLILNRDAQECLYESAWKDVFEPGVASYPEPQDGRLWYYSGSICIRSPAHVDYELPLLYVFQSLENSKLREFQISRCHYSSMILYALCHERYRIFMFSVQVSRLWNVYRSSTYTSRSQV